MALKKIIPCLDIENGRVVKGIKFVDIKDVGDPAECARNYCAQGADEIVFLDISATHEKRKTTIDVVRETAKSVSVPFTVGGGISNIDSIKDILDAGADKVSLNSAAVLNPELIREASEKYGSSRIVVAIDAKRTDTGCTVVIEGGRIDAKLDPVQWAKRVEALGAGEILLTSMDVDGAKNGYDIELTKAVSEAVKIPVTASGGCGKLEDFYRVFTETNAGAALAASLFHYRELTIEQVKRYLDERNIPVRLDAYEN